MKTKLTIVTACVAVLQLSLFPVHAQGTAFTYQGRLEAGGSFADGRYDFAFSLYGAGSGGTALTGPLPTRRWWGPTGCSPRSWILARPSRGQATGCKMR